LNKVTQFAANSIVDLTPLEALDKIVQTVGQVTISTAPDACAPIRATSGAGSTGSMPTNP